MSKMTKNKLAMLALAGLGAVASGPAFAAGMTVDTKGGLEVFELDENNYWLQNIVVFSEASSNRNIRRHDN